MPTSSPTLSDPPRPAHTAGRAGSHDAPAWYRQRPLLQAAQQNFLAFMDDARERVDAIVAEAGHWSGAIDLERSPEFIATKARYIEAAVAAAGDPSERVARLKNVDAVARASVRDPVEALREKRFFELSAALRDAARHPHGAAYWPAKVLLHGLNQASGPFLSHRLAQLEPDAIVRLLDGLAQGPRAYLCNDPDVGAGQLRLRLFGAMPPAYSQGLSRAFQARLRQHGDLAAQAILTLMNQPLAAPYPLVLDGIGAVIACNLATWKRAIPLADGGQLAPDMDPAALAALLARVEQYIAAAREALRECRRQNAIPAHFSADVRAGALEWGRQIVAGMRAYDDSAEVRLAAAHFKLVLAHKKEALCLAIDAQYPVLETGQVLARAERAFALERQPALLAEIAQQYTRRYLSGRLPRQLQAFADAAPDALGPKKICLSHPAGGARGMRARSGAKDVSVNALGQIELAFLGLHNPAYFADIAFIERDGEEEYFRIREVTRPDTHPEGDLLTVIAGARTAAGEPCVSIVCAAGARTDVPFG